MELRWLLARVAEGFDDVTLPVFMKQHGLFRGIDMEGDHFRREPGGEFDTLAHDVAPAVDGDDDDRILVQVFKLHRDTATGEQADGVIVAPHRYK